MVLSLSLAVYLHYTCNTECHQSTDVNLPTESSVSTAEIWCLCVRSGLELPTSEPTTAQNRIDLPGDKPHGFVPVC